VAVGDNQGELVSSECRAETMATYLETVLWRVRHVQAVDGDKLGPVLPDRQGNFTIDVLIKVIRKLKNDRARGTDGVPPEYLKATLCNEASLRFLFEVVNIFWLRREVPTDSHLAQVSAIHKEGRIDLPENYRPISLLNLGTKSSQLW
jgi:hypothetical protein